MSVSIYNDYEALIDSVTKDHPHLVIAMFGPYRDHVNGTEKIRWLCKFQNRTRGHEFVHSGSHGPTMVDALKAGLKYLRDNHEDVAVRDKFRVGN